MQNDHSMLFLSVLLAICAPVAYPALADERLACAGASASPFQQGFESIGKSREEIAAEQAIALCLTALEANSDDPMVHAWLARADYVAGHFDKMHSHLEISANAGDAMGQQILGTALIDGQGVVADPVMGKHWITQSAAQGYASAQYSLGMAYLWGEGTAVDTGMAAHYLELAAEQGLTVAKLDLGALLLEGAGDDADPARALSLFQQAAEAGNAQAMFNLGFLHMTGRVGPPDDDAAFQWFMQALSAGYTPAASYLASLYVEGSVVDKDPQEAARLATAGAQAGDAYGHYILGHLAEYCLGREVDTVQAIDHYKTAAGLGSEKAGAALGRLDASE